MDAGDSKTKEGECDRDLCNNACEDIACLTKPPPLLEEVINMDRKVRKYKGQHTNIAVSMSFNFRSLSFCPIP